MNDSERNVKEQIINNIKRINNIVNDSEKANGFEIKINIYFYILGIIILSIIKFMFY